MEQAEAKRDKEMRPGFVLSILLHVLFVAIFLLPLLPAPPQAKPEQSVNVELVPQQEEKQELATKANEKPDQPPKPTPKPDEKPQQQTADAKQERPQQPQGTKSDEQPPKQSDPQGKQPSEKPPAKPDEAKADKPEKPDDPGADKPVEKAEQQPSATETPLPDMKGDQKDPNTTQQAEAAEQPSDTPPTPPSDATAEQEAQAAAAAAQAQAQAQAEAAQQAQEAQQQADAKDQQANAAQPPASDSTDKASDTAPDVLATNEPSDLKVQQPQAPSTDPNDPQAQAAAQPPSSDPQQQSAAEQAKDEAKDPPQIVVPAVKPSPSQQASQGQTTSSSQSDQIGGAALVTEAQPKSDATTMAVRAKKLYSGVEMARLSKSNYDAWKKMPRRKRVSYLCRSEALAQFGHEFNAPNYVNSAFSPTMLSDTGVSADGLAVPTSKGWYRIAFRCQVDDAALKVTAFSYTNDGRVPRNQLERLGLPAF